MATAGGRLRLAGPTGISAVCVVPEPRGRGRAGRLIGALVTRVPARGGRPFPHVVEADTRAIVLGARLGFVSRRGDLPRAHHCVTAASTGKARGASGWEIHGSPGTWSVPGEPEPGRPPRGTPPIRPAR
ncbi:GNAT family N-acetyltransferase [Streptomyces sennicomposti]